MATGRKAVKMATKAIQGKLSPVIEALRERCENLDLDSAEVITQSQNAAYNLWSPLRRHDAHDFPLLLSSLDLADHADTGTRAESSQPSIPSDHSDEEDETVSFAEAAEYVFVVNSTHIYAWKYLGDEWTDWIKTLHSLGEYSNLPGGLQDILHPYQATGVSKLVALAESTFRGAILGDEMGLGKTLTAISTGMIMQQRTPGAFNLVLAPKSCLIQWENEITQNVIPEPKVLILTDPNMTASGLLDQKPDWVLCSYQYVVSRYSTLQAYIEFMEALKPRSREAARQDLLFRRYTETRPCASLHSSVYELLGNSVNCLFIDEAQAIKNEDSKTYQAVYAIPARYRFMITGTIFGNRWRDVYAISSLLRGHPFQSRAAFDKAFQKKTLRATADPSMSKENRLVKFLQACTIMRPGSSLKLPEMREIIDEFFVMNNNDIAVIVFMVFQFYKTLKRAGSGAEQIGTNAGAGEMWKEHAIYCINIAQCTAANPLMLQPTDEKAVERIVAKAVEYADQFTTKFADKGVGSAEYFYAIMGYLEKGITTSKRKHANTGARKRAITRIKLNPTAAEVMADKHGNELAEELARPFGHNKSPDQVVDNSNDADIHDNDNNDDNNSDDNRDDGDEEEGEDNSDYENQTVQEMEAANEDLERSNSTRIDQEWSERLNKMTLEQVKSPRISKVIDTILVIRQAFPGQKVLVFSKYRKFLDLVDKAVDMLELRNRIKVLRFDGTIPNVQRQGVVQEFAKPNKPGEIGTVLITASCGGAGLNLASASHVILCEPWWRDMDVRQAIARAFRQGQKYEVHVHRIMGTDSLVDIVLDSICKAKAVVIARITKKLAREDGQPPEIPKQYKWGGSGEYHGTR